jgi:hypothetical protein
MVLINVNTTLGNFFLDQSLYFVLNQTTPYITLETNILIKALEESLSITTGRCDLAITTRTKKMHKKIST